MAEATVQEQLDVLGKHMAQMLHHIAEVRKSNHRLETELSEVKSDVSTLKSDVSALRTDMTALETRLQARIDTVETRLEEKIDGVEARLNEKIAVLGAKMSGMSERMRHAIDALGRRTGAAQAMSEDALFSFESYRDETTARLVNLETRLDRLESASRATA